MLSTRDERRLVAAIARAEAGNRAEIQVHIEAHYIGDGPIARARELFHTLGLDRTRDGTGVLLYVATEDRTAAVWAGHGLVGAAAPEFWRSTIERVAAGYRARDAIGGIERALDEIGSLARKAAPGLDRAGNELPDRVSFGREPSLGQRGGPR